MVVGLSSCLVLSFLLDALGGECPSSATEDTAMLQVQHGLRTSPKVFVGIKSAPGYVERRTTWRESGCAQRLEAAGFQYAFVVGQPLDPKHNLTGHKQGALAPEQERALSQDLLHEIDKFRDILMIPYRDQYQDKSNKLFALLHHGYSHAGAQYIMECDDEYCVNPEALLKAISEHEAKPNGVELYGGAYIFKGTEFRMMLGPHNESAPFSTGHGTLLSRGLVKLIVEDDAAHTILNAPYGTSSDDANVGKWVKYIEDKHGVQVDIKKIPRLLTQARRDPRSDDVPFHPHMRQ